MYKNRRNRSWVAFTYVITICMGEPLPVYNVNFSTPLKEWTNKVNANAHVVWISEQRVPQERTQAEEWIQAAGISLPSFPIILLWARVSGGGLWRPVLSCQHSPTKWSRLIFFQKTLKLLKCRVHEKQQYFVEISSIWKINIHQNIQLARKHFELSGFFFFFINVEPATTVERYSQNVWY